MTQAELLSFLEANQHIDMVDDIENEQLCFRNNNLQWYQNGKDRHTAIKYEIIDSMAPDGILSAINKGLEVDGITRITGYMTKVSSWNPGKKAELKDRRRMDLHGNHPGKVTMREAGELQAEAC